MDDSRTTRSKSLRSGLVAAGAALGMTLAGLGVAHAQTTDSTPPADQAPATAPAPPPDGFRGGPRGGHGPMMGGIHGEFVAPAPNGGYQTIATQVGEVTAVSSSSVTVKSEDGFSRTYSVDDGTMVNAGNDGIDDVKTGDKVHVVAVVTDGKAAAKELRDGTQDQALRDRWQRRPQPAPTPASSSSGGTTGA